MEQYQQTGDYRSVREQIEHFPIPSREVVEQVVAPRFFGVNKGELSSQEIEMFELFMKYSYKRVLRGAYHKNSLKEDENIRDHFLETNGPTTPMGMHDMAHVLIAYDAKKDNEHSLVSDFYKVTKPNDIRVLEEEARALIFASVINEGKELPASLLFIDEPTYEGYKKKFLQYVYKEVFRLNEDEINMSFRNDNTLRGQALLLNYKIKGQMEEENTDQRLEELLKRIYKNKDNPKILYTLFYEIAEPLISRLQKVKV